MSVAIFSVSKKFHLLTVTKVLRRGPDFSLAPLQPSRLGVHFTGDPATAREGAGRLPPGPTGWPHTEEQTGQSRSEEFPWAELTRGSNFMHILDNRVPRFSMTSLMSREHAILQGLHSSHGLGTCVARPLSTLWSDARWPAVYRAPSSDTPRSRPASPLSPASSTLSQPWHLATCPACHSLCSLAQV